MKTKILNKLKLNNGSLSRVMVLLTIAVVAVTAGKVIAYMQMVEQVPSEKEKSVDLTSKMDTETLVKPYKELAGELKKRDIFMPPAPKPKPQPPVCQGIIGDGVLVNGKLYKKGDNVQGAEILAVGPSSVRIKWQDKEMDLAPFLAKIEEQQGQQNNQKSAGRPSGRQQPVAQENQPQPQSQPQPQNEPQQRPQMGRGGFGPGMRMSQEQRERMRERWRQMSEEEREEMRNRMRGRRRPGGR
ncbi:hypothetical protein STSP2_01336 [Anaerohalosphaera lusitana]|uniref:Uncharacterized protein n=1 Tax=Anaerohalosphaera lusitana TaxID=1936003 RepID=A0A1U9NJT4_9BACT|nr:hypothetical protein [Anaerohalosphaera lusitana]AQT68181.1 hypothetical protein STSP2_01336 [Anaerohalosphaera lusitana]